MRNKALLILMFFAFSKDCFSQPVSDSLLIVGDKFYKKQEYSKAGSLWSEAAKLATFQVNKRTYYYYAANAYAKAKDSINSLKCLELAVYQYGFNDKETLITDDAFNFIPNLSVE